MYLYSISYLVLLHLLMLCHGAALSEDVDGKIVGGENAKEGEVPYQVSLRLKYIDHHYCGGSIITSKTVMTAAHCLDGQSPEVIDVVVGTILLYFSGVRHEVSSFKIHEKYSTVTHINDIGLIFVVTPFQFNKVVQPISLPDSNTGGGVWLTVSGWGFLNCPGIKPDKLQIIKLKSITYEECNKILKPLVEIQETQICTLSKKGKGVCQGDSGGPLVLKDKIVGIASMAVLCAKGYPDVYTRVFSFVDWIKKNQAIK